MKDSNKIAFFSVFLGVISIIISLSLFFPPKLLKEFITYTDFTAWTYFFLSFFIPILGVLFGLLGLKSLSRKKSILGIIFSLIGLLITALYFFLIIPWISW